MKEYVAEPLDIAAVDVAESPQWCSDALWYCDIEAGGLRRYDPVDGSVLNWSIEGALGCIVPMAGGFAAGTSLGFEYLSIIDGNLDRQLIQAPFKASAHARLNDGIADPFGRFWCGSLERQRSGQGRLFCLERGKLRQMLEGFKTPNGLAFSPDGKKLYISDSFPDIARVWTTELDDNGTPVAPLQPFLDLTEFGGRPDGATVDEDGCYWIAASDSGRVLRFTPQGKLDMAIRVPTTNPTNIAFGGSDLCTAYITSLKPGGAGNALAGCVFAVQLPCKGRPADLYQA
ncbi:sugar lactone lactonase YvrE [Agrobacterium vitis]|nr:sugar lactone lactonase YvrE [Agrobacterium vitis]MBE1439394.1 sugar lactone lactonase YvrE [Agrobacterium vitis]